MEGDVSPGTGTVRAGLGLREVLTPARVEETGGGKIEIDLFLLPHNPLLKKVSNSLPTCRVLDDFILMMPFAKTVNHINLIIVSGPFLDNNFKNCLNVLL